MNDGPSWQLHRVERRKRTVCAHRQARMSARVRKELCLVVRSPAAHDRQQFADDPARGRRPATAPAVLPQGRTESIAELGVAHGVESPREIGDVRVSIDARKSLAAHLAPDPLVVIVEAIAREVQAGDWSVCERELRPAGAERGLIAEPLRVEDAGGTVAVEVTLLDRAETKEE